MTQHFTRAFAAATLVAVVAVPASAQTNSFLPGALVNSPAIIDFQTTGADMTGMEVSWTFGGGGSGGGAWGALGGGLCGVSFGGFSVSVGCDADTFSAPWTVSNFADDRVRRLRFSGAPGRTLFDCGFTDDGCANTGTGTIAGTPNSAFGRSLTSVGGSYTAGILGTYTNRVSIDGNAPVGDLFEQLTIEFVDFLGVQQDYQFLADTDNSLFDQPPPVVVPEPATYAMLLAGLAGFAGVARRRRQDA